MGKQIKYTEPTSFFPKEVRDKYFKTKTTTKKTATKKTAKKSK